MAKFVQQPVLAVSRFSKLSLPGARNWLAIFPVLLGIALFVLMKGRREEPVPQEIAEVARPLRVIEVPEVALVPRVLGYGTAQAGDVWTAVAEVRGRVVYIHPELKPGAILQSGEQVLQIDPAEYELQIAQLLAEISETRSQQAQLSAEEDNLRASLKIEQASLKLAESDLSRLESLATSSSVTESEVERQQREVLSQRQAIQTLLNALNVLPAQRASLAATVKARNANLQRAELDLDHTSITAPFDCRLSELSLEVGQFLSAGEVLFEAHGIDVTEIEAQVPINQARNLINSNGQPLGHMDDAMKTMRQIFNVDVTVRLKSGDFQVSWPARFDRIREQLDLETRTIGIVVAVDKPYEGVIPGQRPPLAPGMFCEVEFRGQPRTGKIVIPRSAVRDGYVTLVNAENRLERRQVEIAFSQGDFTCVRSGLIPGETLVVSDPTPAVEGMLVVPTNDDETLQELIDVATGKEPVR